MGELSFWSGPTRNMFAVRKMPTKLVGLWKATAVNSKDHSFPYLQNQSNENIILEPAKCILLEYLCEREQYRISTRGHNLARSILPVDTHSRIPRFLLDLKQPEPIAQRGLSKHRVVEGSFSNYFLFSQAWSIEGDLDIRAPTLEFQIDHNCPNKCRFLEANTTNSTPKCHSTPKPNKYTVYALISSQQGTAFEWSPRFGHLQHYLFKKEKRAFRRQKSIENMLAPAPECSRRPLLWDLRCSAKFRRRRWTMTKIKTKFLNGSQS